MQVFRKKSYIDSYGGIIRIRSKGRNSCFSQPVSTSFPYLHSLLRNSSIIIWKSYSKCQLFGAFAAITFCCAFSSVSNLISHTVQCFFCNTGTVICHAVKIQQISEYALVSSGSHRFSCKRSRCFLVLFFCALRMRFLS